MRRLKIEERITNRSKLIDSYFNDINRSHVITVDEEIRLAKLAITGDEEAIERLVKANLRFVVSIAKQYSVNSELLIELISQGNIGLIDAAKTFDPTRGFKFISYAVWHIRKEILKYLNENLRTVRVPTNVILDWNKIKKIEGRLQKKLDREATSKEIAEEAVNDGWLVIAERIEQIRESMEKSIALESPDVDDSFAPIEWLSSGDQTDDIAISEDTKRVIEKLAETLNPKEKTILFARYGILDNKPRTFVEIAAEYEKTNEWARQIVDKAIRRMRARAKKLKISLEK